MKEGEYVVWRDPTQEFGYTHSMTPIGDLTDEDWKSLPIDSVWPSWSKAFDRCAELREQALA